MSHVRSRWQRVREEPWRAVTVLAVLTTASLVGVVYFAASSLSVVAEVPQGRGPLSELVACASGALGPTPLGTAVGFNGTALAAFDPDQLVLCEPSAVGPRPSLWPLHSVTHTALDAEGQLYACTAGTPGSLAALMPGGGWKTLAPLACADLVGARTGVVVAEADGTLSRLERQGQLAATRKWPRSTGRAAGLSVNTDGSRLLLVDPPSLAVFNTSDLTPVAFATPCAVEHAGWSVRPDELRVKCAGEQRGILYVNLANGTQELAAVSDVRPRALVPGTTRFIEACGRWPCIAPSW